MKIFFIILPVIVFLSAYAITRYFTGRNWGQDIAEYVDQAERHAGAWYELGLSLMLKCKSPRIREKGEQLCELLPKLGQVDGDTSTLRRLRDIYWPELVDAIQRYNSAILPQTRTTLSYEAVKMADTYIQIIHGLLAESDEGLIQNAKIAASVVEKLTSLKGDIPTTSLPEGSILQTRRDPDVCSEQQPELDENHGVVSQQ